MDFKNEFGRLIGETRLQHWKLSESVGTADESFAESFANHREAHGQPMSLQDWNATMRRALEWNAPDDEISYSYNKFDLAKVTEALAPFDNLAFTPARHFAPVLFIDGPTDTLGMIAKLATKKLGAFEAKLVSNDRLRITWD